MIQRALRFLADRLLPPVVVFVVFVLVWHGLVVWLEVPPLLVPTPARVWGAALEHREALLRAMRLTGAAALCGLALAIVVGSLTAFVFSQSVVIQRGFYPYAIFLQTVPVVAIAPLIILWFGQGFQSVVIVAFILSLFPIITNGTTGLTAIDRGHRELFAIHNATRWQVLVKLRIPNAVPYLVTGARISSGLSVIGAIVGEFFAGFSDRNRGLGYLIQLSHGQLRTAYLFAAILASTLLGLAIFALVTWIGNAIVARWREA
ncbi:MAG TPA: ABC transporter permease [Candidatus Sumerlaeota bacterium]|nr:ABC transporter permease [Candidatus Sumerlaeota bacterium]HOR29181.1 ABC transporter permease [Candidatus Sumerlaeota bacterium]